METLVAVLVLSLSLTGPLVIAQKGLQTALIAKDQITAFDLAQDAIEYVRFGRDTNCLAAGAVAGGCPAAQWLAGNGNNAQTVNLTACVSATGTSACTVDTIAATTPSSCTAGVCAPINYDASRNYFTYASGSPSIFIRTITITTPTCNVANTVCNTSEAAISVTVQWSDPISHSITVKENLLNWQ